MTGPEVTAAVRQGAEAFETAWNEALDAADQSDPVAFIEGVFRKALDAVLDVEEMARVIGRTMSVSDLQRGKNTLAATAIRLAILGADS